MPSAISFGKEYGLVRLSRIGTDLVIVKRSIGHIAVLPNRTYQYPITLTISKEKSNLPIPIVPIVPIGTKRRNPDETRKENNEEPLNVKCGDDESDIKEIKAWFGKLCKSCATGPRMVWTFYGNPYDIWIDDVFTVRAEPNLKGQQWILKAQGHAIRSFTAPKKPPTLINKKSTVSTVKTVSTVMTK